MSTGQSQYDMIVNLISMVFIKFDQPISSHSYLSQAHIPPETYMANAMLLRKMPNTNYITPACVGIVLIVTRVRLIVSRVGLNVTYFALIVTRVVFVRLLGYQHVGTGNAEVSCSMVKTFYVPNFCRGKTSLARPPPIL